MIIKVLRSQRLVRGAALLIGILAVSTGAAFAGTGSVSWTGQGVQCDEFNNCTLNQEICGVENGADVDGPYLLWVFTGGPRVTSATITISNCGSETGGAMTQAGGGAWKYVSDYCDPTDVHASVSYNYTSAPANPQLVISHGCKPVQGANLWCSPGYWRNADDAAWALTSYTKDTLYNSTSCSATPLKDGAPANPTLYDVVKSPTLGGGAGVYGSDAFNCVGALLTDTLCGGGQLNPNCPNADPTICPDACPIDNSGNVKADAPAVCQP